MESCLVGVFLCHGWAEDDEYERVFKVPWPPKISDHPWSKDFKDW